MVEKVGAVVIGAGVIGIAVARALALNNIETLLLDGEPQFGSWTSARNSEVIHAGIYYGARSLKARFCVRGRELLYRYCVSRNVPHRRIGKLIFAASADQVTTLDSIVVAATSAGVDDLQRLSRAEIRSLEPALDCEEALLSPSTGIVDSYAFMLAMLGDFTTEGGVLVCNAPVERIGRSGGRWSIHLKGSEEAAVASPIVVNAAGLGAQFLAHRTDGLAAADVPHLSLARGAYFTYSGAVPFRHLIYPVPVHGGLGTHLTLDMAWQAKFGPDVEWIDTIDYTINHDRKASIVTAAQRIWPELDPNKLQPGYCGIRPKLSRPDQPPADFIVSGPDDHGQPGLVNLFGIESPGLTSSLAIAEHVIRKLS